MRANRPTGVERKLIREGGEHAGDLLGAGAQARHLGGKVRELRFTCCVSRPG